MGAFDIVGANELFGLTSEIEVVLTDSFNMEMTVTKSRLNLVMTQFPNPCLQPIRFADPMLMNHPCSQ